MYTREQAREYNRAWRAANADHIKIYERDRARKIRSTEDGRDRKNAASRKYAKANPEKRAISTANWYAKNPNYNRAYHASNVEYSLLSNAKNRARRKNIVFSLVLTDIIIPEVCPVLGIKIKRGERGFSDHSPSLDRFDPKLGYIKDNVRVISVRANLLKRDATLDELKKIVAYMERLK